MTRNEALREIAERLDHIRHTVIWQVMRRGNRGECASECLRNIADSIIDQTVVRWLSNDSIADLNLELEIWAAWFSWSAIREADRQAHATWWQDHVSVIEIADDEDDTRSVNLIDLKESADETPEDSIIRLERDFFNQARVEMTVNIMVRERKIPLKYAEDFEQIMRIYLRDRVKNFMKCVRAVNPRIPRQRAHDWQDRFWAILPRTL
jgi:hypothetical protein